VVAIVQDVNELRLERERRAEAAAMLASVRERYDLLASTIGEGFMLLDAGLRVAEANPAARRLLSLTADADAPAFEHLSFASPETGTTVTSRLPWQRAARGKATTAELVVRPIEEGGEVRTLEFVASPAPARHIAINVRDVTSRHAMQEDLQKAYARVVEAHTLLQQRTQQWEGNFVSAVQQLGAATASAAPLARTMAADARLPADLRAASQRMVDAFRVHDRLVKHYADVPGGAPGTNRPTPADPPAPTTREYVDVQSLAEEALRLVTARFNAGARITTKVGAKNAICHVDAALVRHALWSIFAHAAGLASRSAARVETSEARSASGRPLLRMVISWPGRSGRVAELALASSLIESEGGTCTFDASGEGTVATVEFEIATATASDASREEGRRTRVLLVEDHDSTARVLSRQLARLRCEVTLATSLSEAESMLAANDGAVDLVVCDLTMPDGSATEFLSRANAARVAAKRAALPAIALRGYGGEHDAKALSAAGFVDQLIKPVDLSALASAIGKISGQRGTFARSQDVIE
jgi:CheY-like chemotaxis protein